MRFHVSAKQGVNPRLIARPLCLEPLKDLLIEPNGHSSFRLRQDKSCRLEKVFVQLVFDRVLEETFFTAVRLS
jgi:hypothetical protein